MILRIAKDKTYLGWVINGKTKKLSYKSKKIIQMPEQEYIIVKDKHEAIVSQERFDKVQTLIASRRKTRVRKHDFLLKGLLECAECGRRMSIVVQRKKDGTEKKYLRCNTYANTARLKLCTPHSSSCEVVTKQIIDTIKTRFRQYLKEDELYKLAEKVKGANNYKRNFIQNQITTYQNKVQLLNKKIDQLYQDKIEGLINLGDFERMYTSALDKRKETESKIIELNKMKEDTANEVDLKKAIIDFIKAKKITREMIVSLVDKITISEDKEIKIYYKFSILNNDTSKESKIICAEDCANF